MPLHNIEFELQTIKIFFATYTQKDLMWVLESCCLFNNYSVLFGIMTHEPDLVLLHIGTNKLGLDENYPKYCQLIKKVTYLTTRGMKSTNYLQGNALPWILVFSIKVIST